MSDALVIYAVVGALAVLSLVFVWLSDHKPPTLWRCPDCGEWVETTDPVNAYADHLPMCANPPSVRR